MASSACRISCARASRLRPDRIPIGEVRGREALDLLKAWGTGHPGGIGTIHAGSAQGALYRLEQLIQEAVVTVPRQLIAETIDLVVVLAGRGAARRVDWHLSRRRSDTSRRLHPLAAWPRARRQAHRYQGRPIMIDVTQRRRAAASATLHLLVAAVLLWPAVAFAAGSNMPWEQPLQQVLDSVQGPVAKIIAVIIIITTGLALAFGETSGGFRRLDPDRVRAVDCIRGVRASS